MSAALAGRARGRPDREHVRQVRLDQPRRAAADGAASSGRWTSCFALAAPQSVLDVGCGEGVLTARWAERLGSRPVVGIDLEDPKLESEWATSAGARTSSSRRRRPSRLAVRRRTSSTRAAAIEVLEHRARPRADARRDGASRAATPARLRAPRAAMAGAEPRPRRLPAGARQHPGSREPLVQAGVCAPARAATAR